MKVEKRTKCARSLLNAIYRQIYCYEIPSILPLDFVTVTLYYKVKENTNMETGDTVKFVDGLYPDEKGARYKVVEINGDRAVIEFICALPIPPQSIAKTSELEVVHQE